MTDRERALALLDKWGPRFESLGKLGSELQDVVERNQNTSTSDGSFNQDQWAALRDLMWTLQSVRQKAATAKLALIYGETP